VRRGRGGASVVVIGCAAWGSTSSRARAWPARAAIACDPSTTAPVRAGVRRHAHDQRREPERGRHGARPQPAAAAPIRVRRDRRQATTLQILDAIRPGGPAVIVGMAAMNVRAPNHALRDGAPGEDAPRHDVRLVRPNLDLSALVDLYLDGRLMIDPAGEPDLQAQRDQRGVRRAAERPGGARSRRLLRKGPKTTPVRRG